MPVQGAPWEYSIAERVHGIIKGEYLSCYAVHNVSAAREVVQEVIRRYNEERPPMRIGPMRPSELHASHQKQQDDGKTGIA